MFDGTLKVAPVTFFAADFNLPDWKSDNLMFTQWSS